MTNQLPLVIPYDVNQAAQSLTREENQMALECAQKVLTHLKRHHTSGVRRTYHSNIEVVEAIIEIHRSALNQPVGLDSLQIS